MLDKGIGENALRRIFELIEEKVNSLKKLINDKANSNHSHSYNSLADKPTMPTKVSQLTNDSEYVTQSEMNNAIQQALTVSGTEVAS